MDDILAFRNAAPVVYRIRETNRTLQESGTLQLQNVSRKSPMLTVGGLRDQPWFAYLRYLVRWYGWARGGLRFKASSQRFGNRRGDQREFGAVHAVQSGAVQSLSSRTSGIFALFVVLSLMSSESFAGNSSIESIEDGKLQPRVVQVGVSVPPQKFLLERIAGDLIETTVLVDQGQSPHHYSPSPAKIRALAGAEIYFASGLEGESHWREKFLGVNATLKWVDAPGGHHQWLAPSLIRDSVNRMADELLLLRPEALQQLEAGRQALIEELDKLDRELSGIFDDSTRGTTFVSNHEAWGAIADQYQLSMLSIHQDGKAPSVRDLATLIATARRLSIDVIIADAGHSSKSAEQIAEAIDGRVVTLNPMEESWFKNMRRAATIIRGALK